MLVLCNKNEARRRSCWLTQIVRRESNAAKRYCDDVCLMLMMSGSLTRRYSTVQPPINTQNDRMYAVASNKSSVASGRLVKGREHFSESRMASIAVSKADKTSVHFVEKGTKVDASYYSTTEKLCCNDVLSQKFVRSPTIIVWVFQQHGAPSHRAKSSSCSIPCQTSLNHLYGPNSPDFNPDD